jgi:hypothetical protein
MKFMLINVNYGELLGAALENVTDVLSKLTNVLPPTFKFEGNYFRQSRGKLTLYKVSPILFDNLPLTAILFTVQSDDLRLLGSSRSATRTTASGSGTWVQAILSNMPWSSSSDSSSGTWPSHEILHHKFILYQARDIFAIASMIVSYVAFALILYEFVLVAKYIIKFYYRIDSLILSEIQSGSGGRDTLRILTTFEMVSEY